MVHLFIFQNYNTIKQNYNRCYASKIINPFIQNLRDSNLVPALFFVFSRKECEKLANSVHVSLVSSEEAGEIDKIFNYEMRNYKKIYEIKWEDYLDFNSSFLINSVVFNSKIFNNSKFTSLKAKDAIVDRFRNKFKNRPSINSFNPELKIEIHVNRNFCTISLDSSGESLHKRGYKKYNSAAPLNEVLAAGIILMSAWDKKSDLLDPMCGTGTFLIEAAMIARNIAPNLNRLAFAFEKWKDWDNELFETIEESVKSKEIEFEHKLYGFDISGAMIKKAEKNIEISGLGVDIEIVKKDF